MCGISGIWITDPDAPAGPPPGSRDLAGGTGRMVDRIAHRGPDDRAVHALGPGALGHARLAIIDLRDGRQPYVAAGGGSALAANGEIYNHLELRARLERAGSTFATRADTEVALHLFDDVGEGAWTRVARDLDGMYALAYGRRDGTLRLVRDPLGIKPLYLSREGGVLRFASEMKALGGSAPIEPVPPGCVWSPEGGAEPHYRVPEAEPDLTDPDAIVRAIRYAVTRATEKRLMSDVPLGAFLSGGLDSSILAALAAQRIEPLHTFAVGVEGSPDLAAARRVADHLGTVHHEHLLTRNEIRDHFERIVWALESFDRDLVRSVVPTYFTARLAARHAKVVLTGEGADELFAGYTYYRGYRDEDALQRELTRSLRSMHNVNLQRVDRLTMTHGLEARVPFLDTELVALAQRIPARFKLRPGSGGRPVEKWALRKAFEDLLPAEIVWRDKAQFDEGSGAADLLPTLVPERVASAPTAVAPQSREEAWYYQVFASVFERPERLLPNVGRWNSGARVAPG